jgi:hypothetical protein
VAHRPQSFCLVAIALLGCGDDSASGAAPGELDAGSHVGTAGDAALGDAAEPPITAQPDAAVEAPVPTQRPQDNVDFASAERLTPGEAPRLQDERRADQVDYYVFAGEAGQFVELTTDRNTFSPDNMLSLYDGAHKLIAQNDDGGRGAGSDVDARLIVRLPESGDYYVTVEDLWTPESFFRAGVPLLFYHLALRELTDDTEGVAIARDDAPVTVRFVEDLDTGFSRALLLAELDTDELTFELAGGADQALIGSVVPTGPSGNGSTLEDGELRVVDDDDHVLAHIDHALGQRDFHPPVDDASYHLVLSAVDTPGDNAFHAIDLIMLADNPEEQAEDDNGEQSDAEPLELSEGTWRRALVLLRLPAGDEDYYVFDGKGGETITVVCEGQSGGSGVRGLNAELLDADGVIGAAVEETAANLSIPVTPIAETGPLYLHVWTDDDAETVEVEPWARCAIDTGP